MSDHFAGPLPLDLECALEDPDWRRKLVWPVSHDVHKSASRRPLQKMVDVVAGRGGRERAILLLAMPRITAFARPLIDVAVQLDAVGRLGRTAGINSGLADMVQGGSRGADALQMVLTGSQRELVPKRPFLRRLARVASWSRPLALLRASIAPSVLAISHNSMLVSDAKSSGKAIGFDYAARILGRARASVRTIERAHEDLASQTASKIAAAMSDEPAFAERTKSSVRQVLTRAAAHWLQEAAHDLDALSRLHFSMPVWSATGGAYPSRAVGLAAIEQGVAVRRYEHVGTGCLVADRLGFDTTERVVSTEVAVPTSDLARFADMGKTAELLPLARLDPCRGDPDFCPPSRLKPRSTRPRVVYATTILRARRQYHEALLPDLVYIEWQMRVAEALSRLTVDPIVKPHPATRYPGGRNPLVGLAPVSSVNFEQLMADADVFLFDFAQTTTFWKALVTSQPVVFLDLGMTAFIPEVRTQLAKRAAIVPVAYDERNLPVLDEAALAHALATAKPVTGDNVFRRWLGGDASA